GGVDLASPSPEGAVLVDVKTSSIRADEAERKAADYSAQRDVYVAAAEAITGRRPAAFRFVFSRPGVSFTTRIDAVEAAAAADRIQRSLAVMATAPDSLAVSPRECYFCGYRRVGLCEGVARPHDSQPELPLEPVPPAT